MISFVAPDNLILPSTISGQLYSGANSQERSQRQTPREQELQVVYKVPDTT